MPDPDALLLFPLWSSSFPGWSNDTASSRESWGLLVPPPGCGVTLGTSDEGGESRKGSSSPSRIARRRDGLFCVVDGGLSILTIRTKGFLGKPRFLARDESTPTRLWRPSH